jgi:hypothetical protein
MKRVKTHHWHTSCHQTHRFTSYMYMHFIFGFEKIKIHTFLSSGYLHLPGQTWGIPSLSILMTKKIFRKSVYRIYMFLNAHISYHWLSQFYCYIQLYYLFLYILELICQQWIKPLTPYNSTNLEELLVVHIVLKSSTFYSKQDWS